MTRVQQTACAACALPRGFNPLRDANLSQPQFLHGDRFANSSLPTLFHPPARTNRFPWGAICLAVTKGIAVPVWAHNPKVAYSTQDDTWIMYHIGNGEGNAKNCTSDNGPSTMTLPTSFATGAGAPFMIHYSKNLSGPWTLLEAAVGRGDERGGSSLFTDYPGVSNVAMVPHPQGGVWLFEQPLHGLGKAFVPFANFTRVDGGGKLAWDACGGPPLAFDNGHPIEAVNIGSRVGSFRVEGNLTVMAGNPCAVMYPTQDTHLYGPFSASSGTLNVTTETNYFEVAEGNRSGYRRAGQTEDPAGCRGVCEVTEGCTSYTWDARGEAGRPEASGTNPGECFLRTDYLWFPNETTAPLASVVSGRPWTFDGDNPAPYIDPVTGSVTVLYRTDSRGGAWTVPGSGPRLASLIGVAVAPSWRGPYGRAGAYGGPISNQDYPFDENEDPFLWRTTRGFHALFHANTWGDSRGAAAPVATSAGRLAFSTDGVVWEYARSPAYNATIRFSNGTIRVLARMERPVLLFDDEGAPIRLINGVQPYSHDDYTFTMIQRIAS